jgi:ABC-type glutathione transport system ATPase component
LIVLSPETEDVTRRMPLLAVENLAIAYRTRSSAGPKVLDGIDLTLQAGESLALVGESGSGKSTLGMAIAGLLDQSSISCTATEFSVAGRPVRQTPRGRLPRATPGVSMVFQDAMSALDPVWTVGSQLVAAIRSTGQVSAAEARLLAADWLRRVELSDPARVMRARPYELSGGMRQRVMLAIAVCTSPRLLIADEPTSALDPSTAVEAMRLLHDLVENQGIALLLISHDIALSRAFTSRTAILHRGRIVESCPSRDLAAMVRHPYATGLLRCVPTLASADLEWLPTMQDADTKAVLLPFRQAADAG